ncbi:uncharacterized protein LOC123430184 [Hordeum vulgare subsp. vulgare]|uniref:Predicted protein n=1 Tax=Hordeum vulgare subsp. vulgare TaxID=112509 RepID=F2EEA4_HORVV|nr:uncharacterized protein LOC123430184 [Hordeum vulgare subsp. vulgare]KAI5015732.1 hypothetical protein ZWY2020_057122 [Hordeum vulgare]BAK05676.1 predicted protein [Hordeum vulgare subsp. vulgare]
MDREQARVSLLVVLLTGTVIAVLAASPAAGDTMAGLAGRMGTAYRVDAAAAQKLTPVVHRRVLSSLGNSVLDPNRPACVGRCGAAGQPYTGRGCVRSYQCRG